VGLGISLKAHYLFQEYMANLPHISRSENPEEQERLEKLPNFDDFQATNYGGDILEIFHELCEKKLKLAYFHALRELIDYGLYLLKAMETKANGEG